MNVLLQDVTDSLYSLPLQEFTSTRNARVKDLRRSDRGLADAVAALPKPTAAAWALNVFSRRHPDELSPLLDLGRQLREAQEQLAGDALRELSAQVGEAVAAVVDRVRASAEHADGEVARREERLEGAATAHERARQRVDELRDELAIAEQDEARAAARRREACDERDAALELARSARRRAEAAQRRLDAVV